MPASASSEPPPAYSELYRSVSSCFSRTGQLTGLRSNGHGCMLQYALLHLFGYKVSMDDLKSFRQIDSILPGHPESHDTEGIEVTTGPLGQGFANAVGLAVAQAHTAAVYNKPGYNLCDNHTYFFFGDGCAMEGIASEAASAAGHLQLGNLIGIYDDNHISIGEFLVLHGDFNSYR